MFRPSISGASACLNPSSAGYSFLSGHDASGFMPRAVGLNPSSAGYSFLRKNDIGSVGAKTRVLILLLLDIPFWDLKKAGLKYGWCLNPSSAGYSFLSFFEKNEKIYGGVLILLLLDIPFWAQKKSIFRGIWYVLILLLLDIPFWGVFFNFKKILRLS